MYLLVSCVVMNKKLLDKTNVKSRMISSMSSCVLSVKEVSCSSLVLMYVQALSTGIAVKRETTSKETIVPSSSIVMKVISFLNCVRWSLLQVREIFLMMFNSQSDHHLRPIVTCINSALYNMFKLLSQILSPLQNHNSFSVINSTQFKNDMTDITVDEDETMVSFDVLSLFTAIPVDKACAYIRTKLEHDTSLTERTQLDIDDIIRLLTFVLSKNFVVHNNTTYKQIHGCVTVVTNFCMELIEE